MFKIRLVILFVILTVIKISDSKAQQQEDEYYYEEPELIEEEDAVAEVVGDSVESVFYESKLSADYQRLFINDIKIDLVEESKLDYIHVFYRDEIVLECDLPQNVYMGNFEWTLDGQKLPTNETSLDFRPSKYHDSKKRNFTYSCFFQLKNHLNLSNMTFPTFILSKDISLFIL